MKKVIRRVYSSDFSEGSSVATEAKPRKKRRILLKVAGGVAVAGAAGYAARNTKAGKAVRKFAADNGGDYAKRKTSGAKDQVAKTYNDYFTKEGRALRKVAK